MRHINKIVIKKATESRASSSCESDIDRQELISTYGNEKYLSKWAKEGQDTNIPPGIHTTSKQKPVESQASKGQEHLPVDDDNASLVSYNSIRDGTPMKNTYLPYQVQQPSQDITLWQGYSGNIYFDSVRCRALRINSSKPNQKKSKGKSSFHRLTKSCSPSIEVHSFNSKQYISYSASSFQSLGSLRIGSRKNKKGLTPCKNQFQYNKLHKGFVEIEDKESVRRTYSSPASLVISGGQVNSKTDPIDRVYRLNTKVRLSSKGKQGSDSFDYQAFPSVTGESTEAKSDSKVNESTGDVKICTEEQTRLPHVGRTVSSNDISEPTPVFIIPFATLDDPVDIDINTMKQEKRTSIESEQETTNTLPKPVKLVVEKPDEQQLLKPVVHKPAIQKTAKPDIKNQDMLKPDKVEMSVKSKKKHKECKPQQTVSNPIPTHIINITGEVNSPRPDFHIRREISNSSLSNYLRAVPRKAILKEQKKRMPKLTYTQRTGELFSTDQDNKINLEPPNGLMQTTALYGGYLPSTGALQNFHVEQSSGATSESSIVMSSPRKEKHHVTRSITKGTAVKNNGTKMIEKCHLPAVIGWNVS